MTERISIWWADQRVSLSVIYNTASNQLSRCPQVEKREDICIFIHLYGVWSVKWKLCQPFLLHAAQNNRDTQRKWLIYQVYVGLLRFTNFLPMSLWFALTAWNYILIVLITAQSCHLSKIISGCWEAPPPSPYHGAWGGRSPATHIHSIPSGNFEPPLLICS